MAIGNQNLYQFRLTEKDKEITEVFNQISNDLYDGGEVRVKDILLVLARSYRPTDSVIIPSQKSLLDGIRSLLSEFAHLRPSAEYASPVPHDENLDILSELDGLLEQFGVETD